MSADFWIGLGAFPIAVIALGAAWRLFCLLIIASAKGVGAFARFTPETSEGPRAKIGAIVYSSRRAWIASVGSVAVVVAVGFDDKRETSAAYDRLYDARRLLRVSDLVSKPGDADA